MRLLRLRDTERVVQYGTQLLDKHSRKLDPEERECRSMGGCGVSRGSTASATRQ